MRKLSKGQKRVLKDYVKDKYFQVKDNGEIFNTTLYIDTPGCEYLLLRQLEKINDYETMWSDYYRLKDDLFGHTIEEQLEIIDNF